MHTTSCALQRVKFTLQCCTLLRSVHVLLGCRFPSFSFDMGFTRLMSHMLAFACLLSLATAKNGMPDPSAHQPISLGSSLLDSYIQLSKPKVSIAAQQSGRAGRTTLTVAIPSSSANQFMPVVSPEEQGTTFDVLYTWDALKVSRNSVCVLEQAGSGHS